MPLGPLALALEVLVNHGAVGGIALDRILGHGAVGTDAELLRQLRAAAVVLVGHAYLGQAVVLLLDHLFPKLPAIFGDDQVFEGAGCMDRRAECCGDGQGHGEDG